MDSEPKDLQEKEKLRKLLLDLHLDGRLDAYLSQGPVAVGEIIYDPCPESSSNWYLSYKMVDGRFGYVNQESSFWRFHKGKSVPFELQDGRFYANDIEICDLFPELKTVHLEEGIIAKMQREL